jgi:hypothetical protein
MEGAENDDGGLDKKQLQFQKGRTGSPLVRPFLFFWPRHPNFN